jgi:RNA polymerase sigma-70 factor (ECF subfamily)
MLSPDQGDAAGERSPNRSLRSIEQSSDVLLLQALADKEVWAMETLYEHYGHNLYGLAYRMIADHQVAEDLVQEAFIAVWQRAGSYSPQRGTVRDWLFSILHHRTIDYIRSTRHRPILDGAMWEEIEQDEQAALPDVWEKAWQNLEAERVRIALLKLLPEQRMVIELAYFQGWTHTEIAKTHHIPLGTVKARMRLALLHLKKDLDHRDG